MFSTWHKTHVRTAFLTLFLLIGLTFILSACRGRPSVTGKWELLGDEGDCLYGADAIEFFPDGKYVVINGFWDDLSQYGGSYSILDESRMRLEVPIVGHVVCEFTVRENNLSLTGAGGRTSNYVRYQEFSPADYPEAIVGRWSFEGGSANLCFEPLEDTPKELTLAPSGEFLALGYPNWYGQYDVSGAQLQMRPPIIPSSTPTPQPTTETGIGVIMDLFSIILGGPSEKPPKPLEDATTCRIERITGAYLVLGDSEGNQTGYRRLVSREQLVLETEATATAAAQVARATATAVVVATTTAVAQAQATATAMAAVGWISFPGTRYVADLLIEDDAVWAATIDGVMRWDTRTGESIKLTAEHGLVSDDVLAIAVAPDGALWFGTRGGGVSRFAPDGSWQTFTKWDTPAWNLDTVWAIAVAPDGALWFGTASGASRLAPDGRWQTFTEKDGLTQYSIQAIAVAPDGALWFGTQGYGVKRLALDGHWQTFTETDGLADDDVQAIAVASDGALWFGTGSPGCFSCGRGVSRLSPDGHWQTFTETDGLADDNVQAIAVAPDGALWFGTNDGVSRLSPDGRWHTFTTKDGLAHDHVSAIAISPDGTVWIGTQGGVSRYRPSP